MAGRDAGPWRQRSFALITQVPDRVTRWYGAGSENLGEQQDTEKSTAFMVASLTQRMEGMAGAAGLRNQKPTKEKPGESGGGNTNPPPG